MSRAADHEVVLLAAGCSRRLAHLTREQPKSFLAAGGERIVERALDALDALGFERVTAVVGYRKESFVHEIGAARGRLAIRYVEAPDYDRTGHGFSFYQARELLLEERRPVLLLHADIVFDPRLLERVLLSAAPDVVAVDEQFETRHGDEVVVLGSPDRITGIRNARENPAPPILGQVVGMNRWSAGLVAELLAFMQRFFAERGPNHNWEPVLDAFVATSPRALAAVAASGLAWVNVNYEEDLVRAAEIARAFPVARS